MAKGPDSTPGTAGELPERILPRANRLPEQTEEQRLGILSRITVTIGDSEPEFAEVLSYFPKFAESSIGYQEAGRENDSDKSKKVRFRLLKYKDANGINHPLYETEGFFGLELYNTIQEILTLRGDQRSRIGQFEYVQQRETAQKILNLTIGRLSRNPEDWDDHYQMILKALEVMEVSPEEINLMKLFYNAVTTKIKLEQDAEKLAGEAADMRRRAPRGAEIARETIYKKYPRQR